MKFKLLAIIALVIIAIQFIPFGRKHTNPPVASEPDWDNTRTRELFFRACYDCHSNETKWPWYSNIAPASWLIHYDVNEGREHFNVSMWGVQKKNKGDEAAKEVTKGDMPPWFFLIGHPEARLTKTEKGELVKGLLATFGSKKEHEKD